MNKNWASTILDSSTPEAAWSDIFASLLEVAKHSSSPVALHDSTVIPDRLLAEAAWELWESYPENAIKTSAKLEDWTNKGSGKAVLILDALSLREMSILLNASLHRGIKPLQVIVTGSECPSTTDQFAKAIGISSRSVLANDSKPRNLSLFGGNCYTDVVSMPFEDCTVPPFPNLLIWHTWLDDLIHLHQRLPDQISSSALKTLQSDSFWSFVDKLRQGRSLVITSDHGYSVSKRFSSEVEDTEAIKILRENFGASRNKAISEIWQKRFMPPIVMTCDKQHIIMGQRKWKVQGGFPDICHGGMSLLEVAVPFLELPAL